MSYNYMPKTNVVESAKNLLKTLFPEGSVSNTRTLNSQEIENFLETIVAEGLEPSEQSNGQFTDGLALDEYYYEGEVYYVWYGNDGYLNIEVGTKVYY